MTVFTGRSKHLGHLRTILDGRDHRIVRVVGIRGGGKSTFVRRVFADYGGVFHTCAPLPDAALRATFSSRVRDALTADGTEASSDLSAESSWAEILDGVEALARTSDRPFVLALDDAHRLGQAHARFAGPLATLLSRSASSGAPPIHVVLIGPAGELPTTQELSPHEPETIELEPLPLRAAVPLLPGSAPEDVLLAYGVFGGTPAVLARLDRDVTVGTNVRRLVLNPEGVLADASATWLERDVQAPARYNAIMSALALGETDWSSVHAGVPDLTRSGQVAPYLTRLSTLGLVTTRRSLDADPKGRSTRYALSDPFLTFWYRFVPPLRFSGDKEPESVSYARTVRPSLENHLRSVFPIMCRQHMRHDAIETLGTNARESGSLWSPDHEIPVAGLLASGAAYYGVCSWAPERRADSPLTRIARAMKNTRYGFGRERRLRIVFTGRPAPLWLRREIARDQDAVLIDAAALVGD